MGPLPPPPNGDAADADPAAAHAPRPPPPPPPTSVDVRAQAGPNGSSKWAPASSPPTLHHNHQRSPFDAPATAAAAVAPAAAPPPPSSSSSLAAWTDASAAALGYTGAARGKPSSKTGGLSCCWPTAATALTSTSSSSPYALWIPLLFGLLALVSWAAWLGATFSAADATTAAFQALGLTLKPWTHGRALFTAAAVLYPALILFALATSAYRGWLAPRTPVSRRAALSAARAEAERAALRGLKPPPPLGHRPALSAAQYARHARRAQALNLVSQAGMWGLLVLLGAVGATSSVWGTGARVADSAAKLALSRIDPVWMGVVRILNATSVVADAADTFRMQLPAIGKRRRRRALLASLEEEGEGGELEGEGGGVWEGEEEVEEEDEDSFSSSPLFDAEGLLLQEAEEEQEEGFAGGEEEHASRRRRRSLREGASSADGPIIVDAGTPYGSGIQPLVPLSETTVSAAASDSGNGGGGGLLAPLRRIQSDADKQDASTNGGSVDMSSAGGGRDPSQLENNASPQQQQQQQQRPRDRQQQQKDQQKEKDGGGGIGAFFATIGKALVKGGPLINATQAQSAARAAGSVVANITTGFVNPMIEAVGGAPVGGIGGGNATSARSGLQHAAQQAARAATQFLLPAGADNPLLNALDGVVDTVRDRLLNATGCPIYCVDLRSFTPQFNPLTNGVPAGPIVVLGEGCVCDLARVKAAAPFLPVVGPRVDASGGLLTGMAVALGALMMHAAAQWGRMRTEAALVGSAAAGGAELEGAGGGGGGAGGGGGGGKGACAVASPLLSLASPKGGGAKGKGVGSGPGGGELSSSSGGGAAIPVSM
jgi:hypothetical protein